MAAEAGGLSPFPPKPFAHLFLLNWRIQDQVLPGMCILAAPQAPLLRISVNQEALLLFAIGSCLSETNLQAIFVRAG